MAASEQRPPRMRAARRRAVSEASPGNSGGAILARRLSSGMTLRAASPTPVVSPGRVRAGPRRPLPRRALPRACYYCRRRAGEAHRHQMKAAQASGWRHIILLFHLPPRHAWLSHTADEYRLLTTASLPRSRKGRARFPRYLCVIIWATLCRARHRYRRTMARDDFVDGTAYGAELRRQAPPTANKILANGLRYCHAISPHVNGHLRFIAIGHQIRATFV